MKKPIFLILAFVFFFSFQAMVSAGDCTRRDLVDWHATITTSVNVRDNCPSGGVVGVVPGGEKVQILEVDKHGDFYKIKTSVGIGFVYQSFLKDIKKHPLNSDDDSGIAEYSNSIFKDLNPKHLYYHSIKKLKERGIVGGTSDGKILADDPINRVELAKILVEAIFDDERIKKATLPDGVYSDVQSNAWYLPYLFLAKEKDILTGDKGKRTVRPADAANGAEVAKMIAVAFDLEVRDLKSGEAWYEPYLETLRSLDALPYASARHKVTRGEMMFMISVIVD